jgi:hypothetical protein
MDFVMPDELEIGGQSFIVEAPKLTCVEGKTMNFQCFVLSCVSAHWCARLEFLEAVTKLPDSEAGRIALSGFSLPQTF